MGFLSSMRKEWDWRVKNGESLRNLEAFRSVLQRPDDPAPATAGVARARMDPMDEPTLRSLVADVAEGRLSRRAFVRRMVALGLTAPLAGTMLA